MESRGAINGSPIATHAIAAGTFVVETGGTADVALSPTASLVARRGVAAAASVPVGAAATARRRRRTAGAVQITASPSALLVRRVNFSGSTNLSAMAGLAKTTISATATLVRRAVVTGSAPVLLRGLLNFTWRYLHRAPSRRRIVVEAERRAIVLRRSDRGVSVAADNRRIVVMPARSAWA